MKHKTYSLLVISSFPHKNETHGQATVGVASYTKNVLASLLSYANKHRKHVKINVFAEQLDNSPRAYVDHGITVQRLWKRNNIIPFLKLIRKCMLTPADTTLISFEFAMFGDPWTLIPFLLLLATLRISKRRVVVALHQVVEDITQLSGHLDLSGRSVWSDATSVALALFYQILVRLTTKVVVFEDSLKSYLVKLTNHENVDVIPHGVENVPSVSQQTARKRLHLTKRFTILCFGYIAWYKGTDWVVNYIHQYAKRLHTPIRLIIAGGPNPNRVGLSFYRRYLHHIKQQALQSEDSVVVTGYVPEKDIKTYFSVSDVVVFPYRIMMSASGPLALTQAYGKPYLLSTALAPTLEAADATRQMENLALSERQLTFTLNETDLIHQIKLLQTNRKLRTRLAKFSRNIGLSRRLTNINSIWWDELMEEDYL